MMGIHVKYTVQIVQSAEFEHVTLTSYTQGYCGLCVSLNILSKASILTGVSRRCVENH